MIDLKLIAKGGLVILIVIAIAILIEQLTNSSNRLDEELDELDNQILPTKDDILWPPTNDSSKWIYNEQFVNCLEEHSKSSYYPINQGRNISISCVPAGRCIHNFLIHSSRALESLNLQFILMEPSVLFCMLPSIRKYSLLTRGFIPTKYKGLRNIITVGIQSSQAKLLDESKTRKRLASFRFRIIRFQENKGLLTNRNGFDEFVPHFFLIRDDMVLHIVVLYPRGTFLFSPGFNLSEMNVKHLEYTNNRAFENFTTSATYLDTNSAAPVLLPSDSRYFLLDMMSSKFIDCKNLTANVISRKNDVLLAVLKELKSILASQMVIFWLWSKSLQGWHEKCDIQYYSNELQFSVAAKSVQGFNFSALFANSSCQHVETYSDFTNNISRVQLNCNNLKINLIFMYDDKITYWTEYVDAKNIYKLRFPKFSLCSTGIYGEKINVPCETSEILESEYGQFLKNDTLILHLESMKNVVLLAERR